MSRDRSGGALRMMGTCQEISERKRAQYIGQMLSAFLDSSDDVIISRNFDGVILSWNRGAQRSLGYSAEEVIGRNVRALVPAERIDEVTRIGEIGACGRHRFESGYGALS